MADLEDYTRLEKVGEGMLFAFEYCHCLQIKIPRYVNEN